MERVARVLDRFFATEPRFDGVACYAREGPLLERFRARHLAKRRGNRLFFAATHLGADGRETLQDAIREEIVAEGLTPLSRRSVSSFTGAPYTQVGLDLETCGAERLERVLDAFRRRVETIPVNEIRAAHSRVVLQLPRVEVEVVDRSITALGKRVDALVVPDDTFLSHGGGVSAAVWEKAGPGLAAHVSKDRRRLRLGELFITPAFGVDAGRLVHAMTVDYTQNRYLGPREADALYRDILFEAARNGWTSLAFPLVGARGGRLGPVASAEAAARAIEETQYLPDRPLRITFATFREGDFETLVRTLVRTLADSLAVPHLLPRVVQAAGGDAALRLRAEWASFGDLRGSDLAYWAAGFLETAVSFGDAFFHGGEPAGARDGAPGPPNPPGPPERPADRENGPEDLRVPPEAVSRFRCAIETRNRLLRNLPPAAQPDPGPLCRAVLSAVGLLLRAAWEALPESRQAAGLEPTPPAPGPARVTEAASGGEPLPVAPTGAGDAGGSVWGAEAFARREGTAAPGGTPPAEGVPVAVAVSPARCPVIGTGPVRAFHRFLLDAMDEGGLRELIDELKAEGYRGDDELILMEYCVRMEDPVEFLCREFTRHALRVEVERRAGRAESEKESIQELAARLLVSFGYPERTFPRGIDTVLRTLRARMGQVAFMSHTEMIGAVTDASSELEYLMLVFLRFLCQAACGLSPEEFFKGERSLLDRKLEQCSLGKLLELLEQVMKRLDSGRTPRILQLAKDFGALRSFMATRSQDITKLRNQLAHFNRSGTDEPSIHSIRKDTLGFFMVAIGFLEGLGEREKRVFPHIVRVDRLIVDRWGRRYYEGTSELKRPERLFTDMELEPGRLYYMLPLTNPLRVDPILVCAGDDTGLRAKA